MEDVTGEPETGQINVYGTYVRMFIVTIVLVTMPLYMQLPTT